MLPLKPQVVAQARQRPARTITRSSPPTRARSPRGRRGTSRSAGACSSRARETWPRWHPACPTPMRRQVAFPDRQVVAFVGDGGFTMLWLRIHHGRQARPADQSRRDQEQRARPDQVGADGLPGQSRVRSRAPADRLRQVRRGVRRRGVPLRTARRGAAGPRDGVLSPASRRSSRRWSIPSNPVARAGRRPSRRFTWPSRWRGEPNGVRSPPPCSATRSRSLSG